MKKIEAIIKPFKLEDVREAVERAGARGMTISEVRGFGRQRGHGELYRGAEYVVDFVPKLKVEMLIEEELVPGVTDAIRKAALTETRAKDVPERELDEVLASGYGIFSGRDVTWATLRFAPERARWVSAEVWHPQQKGAYLADGRYELELPYASELELVMDVMKYGAECEVLGPEELRREVGERVGAVGRVYGRERPAR